MGGEALSKSDIYESMTTNDRDTYDREVTGLRNADILREVRTNPNATQYAKQNNIEKDRVPRFKVFPPPESHTT